MQKLIILGAGGFGREVFAWAGQSDAAGREWVLAGFLDDNLDALRDRPSPGRIIGRISDHQPTPGEVFVCAIGIPTAKRRACGLIAERGGQFANVMHRSAVLAHEVRLGRGLILCPGSIVSANAALEDHVGLNLHATVDHDAQVGAYSQLNCHSDVTGGAVLEEEVFMGSHASVLPGIRVGRGATIGAGAVVHRDVSPGAVVAGVPAKPLARDR